jgi:hypothetical protein
MWHEDLLSMLREFQTQDGMEVTLCLLRANKVTLRALFESAHRGNAIAQDTITSLKHWSKTMAVAKADGFGPVCGCCDAELDKGEVAGFVVLTPTASGIGLVSAICESCMGLERDEIHRRWKQALEFEMAGELHSLH